MKTCPECHAKFEDTVIECPRDKIALPSNSHNPLIGTCLVNRYQIISVIGSGGTGIVYKAHHLQMERPVAIKMMHSHMVARPDALRNFHTEAKTVAQLKHHNIVTLYDFGIGPDNQPFLVMDYIEGSNLKKMTEKDGPISLEQMKPILAQIVDGLAYAHSENVIHQDLKPENIMLTQVSNSPDKVTLVDFGMAALTTQDKDMALSGNKKKKFIGSPYYMSPEQCLSNATIDRRSDIYSLAVVLYEALSDKLPFAAKSGIAMMDRHLHEAPTPFNLSNPDLIGLSVCTEITRVFSTAMAKEPADRYQTIEEFSIELNEALARDIVKLGAIKHRSVAAEQVLVHAKQTSYNQEAINTNKYNATANNQSLESQLQSGKQFLSRQAEIEAACLSHVNADRQESFITTPIHKANIVLRLLERMKIICHKKPEIIISNDTNKEISECPYCQATVTDGVQFCLTCQRSLTGVSWANKLSETRNGNSFTHHHMNGMSANDDIIDAKNNIQNLRQQHQQHNLFNLNKIQRVLNYALIVGIILGGIVVAQSYVDMRKSWKTISQFVHLPLTPNRTASSLDRYRHH